MRGWCPKMRCLFACKTDAGSAAQNTQSDWWFTGVGFRTTTDEGKTLVIQCRFWGMTKKNMIGKSTAKKPTSSWLSLTANMASTDKLWETGQKMTIAKKEEKVMLNTAHKSTYVCEWVRVCTACRNARMQIKWNEWIMIGLVTACVCVCVNHNWCMDESNQTQKTENHKLSS